MTGKRWVILSALAALLVSTGCRGWCERNYPCPQQYPVSAAPAPAPAPCVPCVPCCPTTVGASPAAAPPAWNAPAARTGTCVCPP
jgi:hypothetical protein